MSIKTPVAPAAVAALRATIGEDGRVELSWNVSGEAAYRVLRRAKGGHFDLVTTLVARSSKFRDELLEVGMTYEYEIEAFTEAGTSASEIVSVTTPSRGDR